MYLQDFDMDLPVKTWFAQIYLDLTNYYFLFTMKILLIKIVINTESYLLRMVVLILKIKKLIFQNDFGPTILIVEGFCFLLFLLFFY